MTFATPNDICASLEQSGICAVPGLTSLQVADVWRHLGQKTLWRGHVKQLGKWPSDGDAVTCWGMDDVTTAPHLFELGLRYTPVAEQYLGVEPVLYSMNAFTTYPSNQPLNPDIQVYHRDKDDTRFLALFVYLTDVAADGAHVFKVGSQCGGDGEEAVEVTGPAGTAFLADTRALHLGRRPERVRRTIAWVRWCVSDPPASYVWDRLHPIDRLLLGDRYPPDPKMQRVVRLVAA